MQNVSSYVPIPFLMSSRGWAVFLNTTWFHEYDAGVTAPDVLRFSAPRGDLDYYLFRLDAASPVEITVTPAGDGQMDVKLLRDGRQVGSRVLFEPGEVVRGQERLTRTDWMAYTAPVDFHLAVTDSATGTFQNVKVRFRGP